MKFWKKSERDRICETLSSTRRGDRRGMDCSECGTRLITLGEDGSAKIFDVNSFDMIGMITLHTSKDDDDGDDDDRTGKSGAWTPESDVSLYVVRIRGKRASRVQATVRRWRLDREDYDI